MPIIHSLPEIAARAESALALSSQRPVTYKMGTGGFNPHNRTPWSFAGTLDCSGFAAWCLGVSRHFPEMPAGDWIETSQIHHDATTGRAVFLQLAEPVVGALLVWPDRRTGGVTHQGHVGIVATVGQDALGKPTVTRVIHCSSGNFRRAGNAIQATGPAIFDKAGAILVAPVAAIRAASSPATSGGEGTTK